MNHFIIWLFLKKSKDFFRFHQKKRKKAVSSEDFQRKRLCLFVLQIFQSISGSSLLCPLFAGAGAFADDLPVEADLNIKLLVMVRAGLAYGFIAQTLVFLLLDQLLQGCFIILIRTNFSIKLRAACIPPSRKLAAITDSTASARMEG